jgi:hypothetical protein
VFVTGEGLSRLEERETRSISPENPTGEPGQGGRADPDPAGPARELGRGWKCRPSIDIPPDAVATLADIKGPGAIRSLWFSGSVVTRDVILRIYWEDQAAPSVECPLPDFFGYHWVPTAPDQPNRGPFFALNSLLVTVNPARGLNAFWEMPFRRRCRITLENRHPSQTLTCYYQINYELGPVPEQAAYFHAQFRRVNPLPYGAVYTILDGVSGRGHYVGTSMGYGIHHSGWWGEGEIKFYIDDDDAFPTICGTGTEDYFGGAYNWEIDGEYVTYSTAYMGMWQVLSPDGTYRSQHRQAMYRWHVVDPVRFRRRLRVTIQALGWRSGGRFLPGQHDICSVAYWYQTLPAAPFPPLPSRDDLEIV